MDSQVAGAMSPTLPWNRHDPSKVAPGQPTTSCTVIGYELTVDQVWKYMEDNRLLKRERLDYKLFDYVSFLCTLASQLNFAPSFVVGLRDEGGSIIQGGSIMLCYAVSYRGMWDKFSSTSEPPGFSLLPNLILGSPGPTTKSFLEALIICPTDHLIVNPSGFHYIGKAHEPRVALPVLS